MSSAGERATPSRASRSAGGAAGSRTAPPRGGGSGAVAHAAASTSAPASSGRGRRDGLLLGPEGTLGLTDLRLHARAVELVLLVLALQRLLPVVQGLGRPAPPGQDVAHVVEHDGVVAVLLERPAHGFFRGLEAVQPVERPAPAVLVGA